MRDHYDPRYAKSAARKSPAAARHTLPDLSDATLARTAAQIVEAQGL